MDLQVPTDESELARMREEVQLLRSRLAARDTVLRRAMEERGKALLDELVRSHEVSTRQLEAARHDALTGLLRHGVFRTRLDFECERSKRTGDPMALLLVDIDRFAALNEACGYVEGDRTLARIARCLESVGTEREVRPLVLGREPGARFGAILPGARLDESVARAEAMRAAIERLPLQHRVTARVGVSPWAPDLDGKLLAREAAHALDRAQQEGGNRVVVTSGIR